jgi:hypothetical protein
MLIPLALVYLVNSASAHCTREFLKEATAKYVAAQTAGQSAAVAAFSRPNVTYTENYTPFSIANSTLSQPIKIDFTRSAFDTVQCATWTEIIAATNPHPYVIHTRMVFADHKAALIESIVTDEGDWLFNATGTLELNAPEVWDPIPKEKQDSRAVIQAVGDSYFNRFKNVNVTVPWGPPCYRLEGGLAAKGTLKGEDCIMEWPSTIVVPFRRYVVDEELGVVVIYTGFPGLDRTQGQAPMPDSHAFRVEGGKIKYAHTASSCVVKGCGINWP